MKLGRLVRPLNTVMKEFVCHLQKSNVSLRRICWESFAEWALGVGLSMTYGNFHTMDWEQDLEELLYQLYGEVVTSHLTNQQNEEEENEEEEKTSSEEEEEAEAYSSSRNIMTTSTSSTIARTRANRADADKSGTSQTTRQCLKKQVSFSNGTPKNSDSTSKQKTKSKNFLSVSAKRKIMQLESDEEDEPPVMSKKNKRVETIEEEEATDSDSSDNLDAMLDGVVQQQSLQRTTGSISQSIVLKHHDSLITLKSRGERGTSVVKLDIYPYFDCLKHAKNDWWRHAKMRSCFLSYSEDSRVQKLVDQLAKEALKQIKSTKNVEIEQVCRLEKWLEAFIICPPQNIFYTGHWCNGPFKYFGNNHELVRNSFHNIRQRICDMSVKEIFLKTRTIPMERLIYVGPWNDLSAFYYNIRDSLVVLETLLQFQYPDKYQRYIFVSDLYSFCNRKVPKKNCMFILGPANSGKNYFFDCLCHSLINFGCMGNFNKYNNFPLQECVQRRIISWNEPNFEPGSEETLKLIFGGDTCNVKVKFQPDVCMLSVSLTECTGD